MNRRGFALGLLGAGVGLLLTRVASRGVVPTGVGAADMDAAALLPWSAQSARRIGRRLVAVRPDLADRAACAAEIRSRLGGSCGAARRRAARLAVAADFDAERTVLVDGWILSRFEASLCVLQALG